MRILPIVAVGVCLSLGTCTAPNTSLGNRVTLYEGVDYRSFVSVAAIDPAKAKHVTTLLDTNGVPNLVEGSVVYGVSVPPAMKEKAIALLKADSQRKNTFIRF